MIHTALDRSEIQVAYWFLFGNARCRVTNEMEAPVFYFLATTKWYDGVL